MPKSQLLFGGKKCEKFTTIIKKKKNSINYWDKKVYLLQISVISFQHHSSGILKDSAFLPLILDSL